MRKTRINLFVALLALCQGGALAAPQGLSHTLTPLDQPVAAPGFSLEDLDEANHRLADYRGRVVVINFWAVWCPPCRREMPSLERLRQRFKDRPFAILAINEGEDVDRIQPFLWDLEPSPGFTVLLDTDLTVSQAFAVRGLPTSFILDKQGRIVYRAVGGREFDHPEMVAAIEALLAQ